MSPDTLLVRVDHSLLKAKGKASTLMVLFPEEKDLPSVQERSVSAKEEIFSLD